jgi:succinoglycan biosynthesis protein ExoO
MNVVSPASRPIVSVAVANYNGARFIADAIASVRAQTLRNIEIIVADDGSDDESVRIVSAISAVDSRVRLIRMPSNQGVAAARNLCLDGARGRWIAIFDSDDLMHPERLERLVSAAERDDADMVADDLLVFHENSATPPVACLTGKWARGARWVGLTEFVEQNPIYRGLALGFLKPVVRSSLIRTSGICYDTTLTIGEDYDFVARLLGAGGRYRVYPELTYFYRKHTASVSHRLTRSTLCAMLGANERFRDWLRSSYPVCWNYELSRALERRQAMLRQAVRFDDFATALKQRRWYRAGALGAASPGMLPLLRIPIAASVRSVIRRWRRSASRTPGEAGVSVLSRQRVIGKTSGSSTYLLNVVETLARAGLAPHFICPNPAMFGRVPILVLGTDMKVFRSIRIRSSLRVGRLIVATDPIVWLRAVRGVVGRALARAGLAADWLSRPAPYAIAVPWERDDFLFVARHARPLSDVILADYAFLAEGFPYVLRPDAPGLVVMHDLFSSRPEQFRRMGLADTIPPLDREAEMRLLSRCDAVIAIQQDEAKIVRAWLRELAVLVTPLSVSTVDDPQPGTAFDVLFVGSKALPNLMGLKWFINEVWPAIRQSVPDARLMVCGDVVTALDITPDGVTAIGYVDDLTPYYRRASVVVSPLIMGTGLKIKLIEALAHGKAIVATTVTLQGVEPDVGPAVMVADEPEAFASAVVRLLSDSSLRTSMGQAALAVAASRYSAAVCHAELLRFLGRTSGGDAAVGEDNRGRRAARARGLVDANHLAKERTP